jgi:hypothetical protein
VLNHLDDLDADFRVFYRVDDIGTLTGPRFLALALRVFAYQGVMAARVAEQQDTPQQHGQHGTEVRQVEPTRAAITADPVLSQLVSWGEG